MPGEQQEGQQGVSRLIGGTAGCLKVDRRDSNGGRTAGEIATVGEQQEGQRCYTGLIGGTAVLHRVDRKDSNRDEQQEGQQQG